MKRIVSFVILIIFTFFKEYNSIGDSGPFEGFVVGGVSVPIMMYPHVAQLKLQTQVCGGSIISNRVILTAAHCLVSSNGTVVSAENVTAYLGSDSLMEGYKYGACKIIAHEKYNTTDDTDYYFYDLGLILLKESIKFGHTVKKVNIANTEEFRNERYSFTIAGFGTVTNLFPSGPSKKLKATRMFYINSKKCEQTPSPGEMDVPDHMFCLIGKGWTSDCFGDSGSGIIWRSLLVGVVSIGRDVFCGSDMLPSMYTDIVYFRDWIKEHVTELESLPVNKCENSYVDKKKKRLKSKKDNKTPAKSRLVHKKTKSINVLKIFVF